MHESDGVPPYILDLDRQTIEVGNGYWVTMRVQQVKADANRPHGLSYALSLHSPTGRRLLGYDNAHLPPSKTSGPARKSKQPATFDHVHRGESVAPYTFVSPVKLVEDFWEDVDRILAKEGIE